MISFICLLIKKVGSFSDHQQSNQVQCGSLLWGCMSMALPRFILLFLLLGVVSFSQHRAVLAGTCRSLQGYRTITATLGGGLKLCTPLPKLELS